MKTTIRNLGEIGLVSDKGNYDIPPNGWSILNNVRCLRGYITPVDGYSDITDTGDFPNPGSEDVYLHSVVTLQTETDFFFVCPYDEDGNGIANKIYTYNGGVVDNVTRQIAAADEDYTGSVSDLWSVCNFNGLVILNNGVDNPQYWTGSGKCQPLLYDGTDVWTKVAGSAETEFGGVPYAAKVIKPFGPYLFAMHITQASNTNPYMVHWSNPADPSTIPSTWDYTDAANDSGRTTLTETGGHVVDALTLGDTLIIYKEDAVYRVSHIGGQYIFDFNLIMTSHGLWSTNCVVDIGNRHVCLGDGVVYTHTGGQPENILEGRAADELFSQIDTTNYRKCFLVHRKEYNEVMICYPEAGYTWANKALIWNYTYNTWHRRDIPQSSSMVMGIEDTIPGITTWDPGLQVYATWADWDKDSWVTRNYSPIGDTLVAATKQLTKFGVGKTSDVCIAQRSDLLLGDPDDWFKSRKVILHIEGDPVYVTLGGQNAIGGVVTWASEKEYVSGIDTKVEFRVTAPIYAFRLTGTGDWRLSSYTLDYSKVGMR